MKARKESLDTVKQQITKILKLERQGVMNENIAKRFGVSGGFLGDLLKESYDKTTNNDSSAHVPA